MSLFKNYYWCILLLSLLVFSCNPNSKTIKTKANEAVFSVQEIDSITSFVMGNVNRFYLNSEERRLALDSAIVKYPSIAYLYQQRAMPLYKEDKDELGLPFLEKAAELDPKKYVEYMAFMKCIFSKNYKGAIIAFNKALELNGESYVMDHSYYFYLGLCNLQLNQFEKATKLFDKSIAQSVKEESEEWIHFTDLMYLGIAHYELKNYEKAIENFDNALSQQPKFSDVKYYKALCLFRTGETNKAKEMFKEAKEDFLSNNVMYEDNSIYERYPYQVRKSWFGL